MDWKQFVSSALDSVAWPAVVVLVVFLLRKPIGELVLLLRSAKYKDLELAFGRRLAEAREDVDLEEQSEAEGTIQVDSSLIELARVSPRAVVTEAWMQLEATIMALARSFLGPNFRANRPTFRVLRQLENDERLDAGAVSTLRTLRSLRNDAVHSSEFALTADEALDYARTSRRLVAYLEALDPGVEEHEDEAAAASPKTGEPPS